jgi:hypothetical protein
MTNNILPGTGSYTTKSNTQNMGELNKNLRQLNDGICCLTEATTTSTSDYEYIPVYEFIELYTNTFAREASPFFSYTPTEDGGVTFTLSSTVSNICSEFSEDNDPVIGYVYEDSAGRVLRGQFIPFDVSFRAFGPSKNFTIHITITRTSGFIQTHELIIYTDAEGVIDSIIPQNVYSNTNRSNGNINLFGLIPTTYEVMVQDILEVRQNGTFLKYVDLAHADYTPRYCLSYNPVMPFSSMYVPKLNVTYNNASYTEVSSITENFPVETFHIFSVFCISGTVTLSIGGAAPIPVPVGLSLTYPFTSLNTEEFVIDATSGVAYISTTKP